MCYHLAVFLWHSRFAYCNLEADASPGSPARCVAIAIAIAAAAAAAAVVVVVVVWWPLRRTNMGKMPQCA